MNTTRKAELNLLLITALWGLTFPLIGGVVKNFNPMDFVALRFGLASLVMLPFIWQDLRETCILTIGFGALLGCTNLGSYWLQALGLQTLGSGESAFITSTAVIIVPCILLLSGSHKPTLTDFISSLICLVGLYILTGADLSTLNTGEIMTLLCALCYAMSIIITQSATNKIKNFKLIAFYQIAFTALFAVPFSYNNSGKWVFEGQVIFALIYCAVFATIIVLYLQTKYQKYVSASKAALIFCAEPLFAVLYSWALYSEEITLSIMIGGAIILISITIPDLLKLTTKKL